MNFHLTPVPVLRGEIRVPSDKSISHRALLFSALASGSTRIENPLLGDDVIATMNALRACGISISEDGSALTVHGAPLAAPPAPIDCGNSGTLMRLFCGAAAAANIPCTLVGDESLMQRPMNRVAAPLAQMGAAISAGVKGCPPIELARASAPLKGILYSNTLNSAQVKSAILLAGLAAQGATVVADSISSRDHSERLFALFGAAIRRSEDGHLTEITPGKLISPGSIAVPADISSAIFFIIAAAISADSDLLLTEVGINPTRMGGINILLQMGADIDIINRRKLGREPVADIRVRGSALHGIDITPQMVPAAIDDLPALMIAAAAACGESRLSGAAELRHKESDRISAMTDGLKALGIGCEETPDGILISGKRNGKNGDTKKPVFSGGEVDSRGDHRIAMAFAGASLRAKNPLTISNCANVATSFPNFVKAAGAIGMRIVVQE